MRFALSAILLVVSQIAIWAGGYAPKDVPIARYQDASHYVCDPDALIAADSVAVMDSLLLHLEQQTGVQTLVVVVEAIEDGDCYQFAQDLGGMHGVGQKDKNNGLVIVLSTEDRCVFMATGTGLEADLPDAICKRIQEGYMNEHFSGDEWTEGLTAGVRATCSFLEGEITADDMPSDSFDWQSLLVVAGILLLSFFSMIRNLIPPKCPKCKKWPMKKYDKGQYKCPKCGCVVDRNKGNDDDSEQYSGDSGTIFHGGFSDSDSLGDSFGGGIFGGGGAGSKF